MTKVELVKGTAFELDASKRYLLVFDRHTITADDIHNLLKQLGKEGFKGLGVMLDGDPSTLKVMEQ